MGSAAFLRAGMSAPVSATTRAGSHLTLAVDDVDAPEPRTRVMSVAPL
jgi:hypothetical protein